MADTVAVLGFFFGPVLIILGFVAVMGFDGTLHLVVKRKSGEDQEAYKRRARIVGAVMLVIGVGLAVAAIIMNVNTV